MKNFSPPPTELDKKLDAIGRDLLAAAQADDSEIQAAADAPFLYQRVRAQMAAAQLSTAPARVGKFSLWQLKPIFWGLAGVVLVAVIFLQWQHFTLSKSQVIADKKTPETTIPAPVQDEKAAPNLDVPIAKLNLPAKPIKTVAQKIRRVTRRQAVAPQESTSDFMPLTYVANATSAGGQIVRVEMPRTTLLALGVQLPEEPTQEQVKADVLLSNEGLALAIRVVR